MDILTIIWIIAVIAAAVVGFILGAFLDRLLGFFKTRHQRELDRIERLRLENLDYYLRAKARIDSATYLAEQRIHDHVTNHRQASTRGSQTPPASDTIQSTWTTP